MKKSYYGATNSREVMTVDDSSDEKHKMCSSYFNSKHFHSFFLTLLISFFLILARNRKRKLIVLSQAIKPLFSVLVCFENQLVSSIHLHLYTHTHTHSPIHIRTQTRYTHLTKAIALNQTKSKSKHKAPVIHTHT